MFLQVSSALAVMAWAFDDEKFIMAMAWLALGAAVCVSLYSLSFRVQLGLHLIALPLVASFICWREGWAEGYGLPSRQQHSFVTVKGVVLAKLGELGLL